MDYGCVYCISNTFDDKKYIGLTTRNILQRMEEHKKANSYIGNSIRKHGENNFKIEVIDTANSAEELSELEVYWIREHRTFKNGYNLTVGGDGVNLDEEIHEVLTKEQIDFLKTTKLNNKKELDIKDTYAVIESLMDNSIEMYLNAKKTKERKLVAEFIYKLKPKYIEGIRATGLINFEEMETYLEVE